MAFGRRSGPAMQYLYGADVPLEGLEEFDTQLRLANEYRNRLIEIELERRRRVEQLLSKHQDAELADEVQRLATRLEELRQAIRLERQRARSRKVANTEELEREAKEVRAQLREARQRLREMRRAVIHDPVVKDELHRIDLWARDEARKARHEFSKEKGLYWGTYMIIEQAVDRARRSKYPPRLKKYTGEGSIAIQIQHGMPWEDIFNGKDTRIQVAPVPPEAWLEKGRCRRAKMCRTIARIRIGTNPDRTPKWLEIPFWMHRPMPAGAKVKWVRVQRRRQGLRWKYSLLFTIELPSERLLEPAPPLACGIDVGWRKVQGGLRVAYVVGEDGFEDEVLIPESWLEAMDKVSRLRSHKDRHFNEMKEHLLKWLQDHPDIPEWLLEDTATLAQWRSPLRMVELLEKWSERRFAGDEEIFERLSAWRKQDRHLYQWQADLRAKLLRHRREIYRIFAKRIAERYRYVCIERMNLRQAASLGEAESPTNLPAPVRYYRTVAAVSLLRQCLENALRKRGGQLVIVDPKNSTQECHVCGHLNTFDASAYVIYRCKRCGSLWDQDRNAAINILRRSTGVASMAVNQ